MKFSEVIGQAEVKQHLLQMVHEDKLPHALMFCGPQGAGKLPLALAFAQYLLCENPSQDEACQQCSSCRMLEQWSHPDLHFSFPVCKKKSTDHPVSDDFLPEWREQLSTSVYFDTENWLNDIKAENQQIVHYVYESDSLQKKLALKASQGGRQVIILWLPERMNIEMANKLLKLIEEPPQKTHFLLVSEEPEMVLGTIQSRVQRINVPALNEEEISQALQHNLALPPDEANVMGHVAQGSYTEALKRVEAGSEEKVFFDLFKQLMRQSYMRKIKELRQWADTVSELGRERQKRLLIFYQRMIRENFMFNFHRQDLNYETMEENDFSVNFARFINEKNVIRIMNELSDAQRDIEQNVNPRMVFFDLSLKMIVLLINKN